MIFLKYKKQIKHIDINLIKIAGVQNEKTNRNYERK
ncbi:MAG: hypothetical protein ACJAXJ_001479 [Colwellia sp.]|jgi:hypothetical protein|tara:strand:- start:622 stop:729 length:108 start_codon:yes stop_codon:yes gene_type:complete